MRATFRDSPDERYPHDRDKQEGRRVERVAVSYIDFVEWKSLDEKEKFFNDNDDVNPQTYIFICTILWIK